MLLSKRIAKLRKLPNFQSKDDSQTSKITKDTKKSLRCRFTEIPPPAKYVHSSSVHTILGDIPCMYYKGNLVTEISLYNEIKNYKDVTVTKVNDQAVITIKPTMKNDKDMPDWSNLTSVLSQTGNEEMTEWAKNIKSYCHTYSKVMQRQSRKKMKSGPRKQFFYQVTDYTNDLCNRLFENYPCLKLKFRIKNHQNQVKEILVNESLAKEMGYSVDGFVTNVLQEGLPQMMPYENPLAPVVVKALIKNYFTIGDYGYEIGELACPLLMKSNFAKNMTFRTYFLMNYEDTVFGMDLIIAVTSVDEPYVLPKIRSNQELNADFVELMSSQEGEIDYFVSNFYDHSVKRTYTNFYKTCMLKEIGHTNDNSGDKDDDDNNDKNIGCKTEFQLKYEMNE